MKDGSDTAKNDLTDACCKYLKSHPGVVFFAAGPFAEGLDCPVNVRDFHVGLYVVFKNMELHDRYQTSPMHLQFIEQYKDTFQKVRVFDTLVR